MILLEEKFEFFFEFFFYFEGFIRTSRVLFESVSFYILVVESDMDVFF